jgi:hypothetical protein
VARTELALGVSTGTEEVDDDDNDETHGDPNTVGDSLVPVVDQNGGGGKLGGENDGPVVPIVPTHGETESGVDESRSESDWSSWNRQVRDHFTEGDHGSETDGTHESVTHE